MPTFQLLPVIGAVGLLICATSLIALHILPTGFHPIHDPVSNYAVSRYGFLYRLQAFSSGICGVCLLAWFAESGSALLFWGIAALIFYSLSRMLIIFFPTDVKPPRTSKGPFTSFSALLTDVAAIAFLVVFVVRPFRQIVGLIERRIYLGTLLWLGIVFVQLLLPL